MMSSASLSPLSAPLAAAGRRAAWIAPRAPRQAGDAVVHFADSDDFLLGEAPYDFGLYVIAATQLGVAGPDLVRLVRRRSAAPIAALVASADAPAFLESLAQGADLVLPPDLPDTQLEAALAALLRRCAMAPEGRPAPLGWTLENLSQSLRGPLGELIALSEAEWRLMCCFATTGDGRATRQQLCESLWGDDADERDNALHATLYRLRKHIEQATHQAAPIRSVARVGYEFRAPLLRA